tara:strand:+ start:64 stop:1599 length:1536 start_codon:yes stop_codon:yes gene_type:complete
MNPGHNKHTRRRPAGVRRLYTAALILLGLTLALPGAEAVETRSITDTTVALPTVEKLVRVLSFDDYNLRVVALGSMMLGIAAGIVGSFMLLRRRALMGDAISHATLPGIGVAFLVMTSYGGSGKFLPGLLTGALVFGMIGMGLVLLIRTQTRLKEDAALGIVLSVFFGLGVALLGIIQQLNVGHAAGLESFIYGKTASMLASDAWLIGAAALVVIFLATIFFKEFSLVCFDQDYSNAQGRPSVKLDIIMMSLVVVVTVIGLQAVGLILMIALLIIPAAAARFWTYKLGRLILIAALIGEVSCLLGACISALAPRIPAGAVIVVVATGLFIISMIFGSARGVVHGTARHRRVRRTVERQHLLRALFEWNEEHAVPGKPATDAVVRSGMPLGELMQEQSWTHGVLRRAMRRARRDDLIRTGGGGRVQLTIEGLAAAERVVRNHRLWETYLITHADIAPIHVDSNADQIEHVLGHAMVAELERLSASEFPGRVVPPSPHVITRTARPAATGGGT